MTLLSYIVAIVLYCIVKSDGRDNPPNLVQTLPKSMDTLFLSVLHHYRERLFAVRGLLERTTVPVSNG